MWGPSFSNNPLAVARLQPVPGFTAVLCEANNYVVICVDAYVPQVQPYVALGTEVATASLLGYVCKSFGVDLFALGGQWLAVSSPDLLVAVQLSLRGPRNLRLAVEGDGTPTECLAEFQSVLVEAAVNQSGLSYKEEVALLSKGEPLKVPVDVEQEPEGGGFSAQSSFAVLPRRQVGRHGGQWG